MYTGQVIVRFGDIDQAGIVYFPRFFNYCHMVYEDYLNTRVLALHELIRVRRIGFPIVRVECDFKSPLRYGDVCEVELQLLKLGGTSLTYRYRLYKPQAGQGRVLCAEAKIITACMDMDTQAGTLIPSDIRALLARDLEDLPSPVRETGP